MRDEALPVSRLFSQSAESRSVVGDHRSCDKTICVRLILGQDEVDSLPERVGVSVAQAVDVEAILGRGDGPGREMADIRKGRLQRRCS